MSKKLNEFVGKFLQDPRIPRDVKNGVNTLLTSHLASGQKYERMGMLDEAIAEYAKEYDRPIKSVIDAEIVQKAYCQTGEIYRELRQVAKSMMYFQKARELLNMYGAGTSPHMYLAEMLIEQGQIDSAIEVYEEYVQKWPDDNAMKQLLFKAREKRDSDSNRSDQQA